MANFEIPASQAEGIALGMVVKVIVRGTIRGISLYGDDDKITVDVDGEASIEPGTFNDAARMAFKKLSDANDPVDFPIGQRELHAP